MLESVEREVLRIWDTHKDLSEVFDYVCELDEVDVDELANLLLGLVSMFSIRMESLMRQLDIADTTVRKVLSEEYGYE